MLLRQIGKHKVATLKRVPKSDELARLVLDYLFSFTSLITGFVLHRFDISMYPKASQQFHAEDWQTQQALQQKKVYFGDLTRNLGERGNELVRKLFRVSAFCPSLSVSL